MRRDALGGRAEVVLVPLPDGPAEDGIFRPLAQRGLAAERLIPEYAADGWAVVTVRAETAPPLVLFRRPQPPSAA